MIPGDVPHPESDFPHPGASADSASSDSSGRGDESPPGSHPEYGADPEVAGGRDRAETLAALAAVEGRWMIQADDDVDDELIDELELVVGAIFMGFSLESEFTQRARQDGGALGMSAGAADRLERVLRARAGVDAALEADLFPKAGSGIGRHVHQASNGSTSGSLGDVSSTGREGPPPAGSGRLALAGQGERASAVEGRSTPFGGLLLVGWAAAAALLIGLIFTRARVDDLERLAGLGDASVLRAALVEEGPDVATLAWTAGPHAKDPYKDRLGGDVAWSDTRNEGYMRISGLPKNDPDVAQYQLWIFRGTDPGAELYPVDGGVFNISDDGEAVITIDAKLAVGHAGLFAVTKEAPGGVVVSERQEIVLLATSS